MSEVHVLIITPTYYCTTFIAETIRSIQAQTNLALYRRRKNSITPKNSFDKILFHYPLFRKSEQMNILLATFWVGMNIICNSIKKIFYIKKNYRSIPY